MHRPGHKQKYSNRPSIKDLDKRQKVLDIKNLRLYGLASQMQDFLSQSKKMPASSRRTLSQTGRINPYQRETLWDQWRSHGKPSIKQKTPEQFQKEGSVFKDPEEKAWWHNKPRAYYGWDNTLNISPGDVGDFQAELAHASQVEKKGRDVMIKQYTGEIEKYGHPLVGEKKKRSEKMYDVPGTMEYEAHSEIQPELTKEYYYSTPKSYWDHLGR